MRVEKLAPHEWGRLGELAHKVCFNEFRPDTLNKHHFVMAAFVKEELYGYTTCLEMDSETLYLQYGGAFPNCAGTVRVMGSYVAMLDELEKSYKRVWTRIKNTNRVMLKLALQVGFLICGVYHHNGDTFVEMQLEFKKLEEE